MKIAICDNELLFAEAFKKQLVDAFNPYHTSTTIFIYNDLQSILDEDAHGADLIFMDMEWCNRLNGLDIAEALYQHHVGARVIYVTGHIDRFVQQIYLKQTNVAGILTKPVDSVLLEQLLDKIMRDMNSNRKEDFVIHQKGHAIRLTQSQVLYMESKNHVLEIVTEDQTYRLYQTLNSLLPALPDCFIRCHRSYVVNMNKIRSIGRQELLLENDTRVPIGRMYNDTVKKNFVDWVSREI